MDSANHEISLLRLEIHRICGLFIPETKFYLIRQRLEPLLVAYQATGYQHFLDMMKDKSSSKLLDDVISAMTTNETSFFRDDHPYETFRDWILPRMVEQIKAKKATNPFHKGPWVRIWSAASSTGQEPYSLAMVIMEYIGANPALGLSPKDFSILATDISSRVLSQAMAGEYNDLEIKRGLPPVLRDKYFTRDGRHWVVKPELKAMTQFQRINLTEPLDHLGGYDFILCRNVLIYFDDGAKREILAKFNRMLLPQGILMLGASENTYNLSEDFDSFRNGSTILYQPK